MQEGQKHISIDISHLWCEDIRYKQEGKKTISIDISHRWREEIRYNQEGALLHLKSNTEGKTVADA